MKTNEVSRQDVRQLAREAAEKWLQDEKPRVGDPGYPNIGDWRYESALAHWKKRVGELAAIIESVFAAQPLPSFSANGDIKPDAGYLWQLLREYGQHKKGCTVETQDCTCGFSSIISRIVPPVQPVAQLSEEEAKEIAAFTVCGTFGSDCLDAEVFTTTGRDFKRLVNAIAAELVRVSVRGYELAREAAVKIAASDDHRHSSGYHCERGGIIASKISALVPPSVDKQEESKPDQGEGK
jgi:hypothetical protein